MADKLSGPVDLEMSRDDKWDCMKETGIVWNMKGLETIEFYGSIRHSAFWWVGP